MQNIQPNKLYHKPSFREQNQETVDINKTWWTLFILLSKKAIFCHYIKLKKKKKKEQLWQNVICLVCWELVMNTAMLKACDEHSDAV